MPRLTRPYRELLRLYGVAAEYRDAAGTRRTCDPDVLLAVLRLLGVSIDRVADAPRAFAEARRARWRRPLPPVIVAWDGRLEGIRWQSSLGRIGRCQCRLWLETGGEVSWDFAPNGQPPQETVQLDGVSCAAWTIAHPPGPPLPQGYHTLAIEEGEYRAEALLISAPRRAWSPPDARTEWGVFAPVYALRSNRNWGAGDLADLETLGQWVHAGGGGAVATLPLLAGMLDEPYDPSPYSPSSRMFWSELYLDLAAAPEMAASAEARAIVDAAEFRGEAEALRREGLVEPQRTMALKRRVLAALSRQFFSTSGTRRAALDQFLGERPEAADFARFRAVGDRQRTGWRSWPAALRDRHVTDADYDQVDYQRHLFTQFLAAEQFAALADRARGRGLGLYLDLPLGVHGQGYDVWRHREQFVDGAAAGAPPDPFFPKGQNWGFPPPHPELARLSNYRYLRAYVRHHARHAGLLRIDHAMGLHRLYWIPQGVDARDGVYVRNPAEELYAVFVLESHRHRCALVGEDLGTVPAEVPRSMRRHGIGRMYVSQYEVGRTEGKLTRVFSGAVASVNTHDMPPLAAWWQGTDIDDRVALGILDANDAEPARADRADLVGRVERKLRAEGLLTGDAADVVAVLRALLRHLADGRALLLLVNLEDLWGETQPQNVPGTWLERPNWRRKLPHTLEEVMRLPQVVDCLRELGTRCRR
jgi:4-alpha-glucanotransferase